MRKKLISFISAVLAVAVSCSAISVIAVENTEMQTNADMSVSEEKLPKTVYEKKVLVTDLPDSEELERMYIEKLFYGSGVSLYADYGHNLTGTKRELYDLLRTKIEAVAKGEITGTVFNVSRSADIPNGSSFQEAAGKLSAALSADLDVVLQYLLVDLPEDFYWFDKLTGMSIGGGITSSGNTITAELDLKFAVSRDYMGADNSTVDPAKINAAKAAVKNAQAVAAANAGKSDYEKILAFRDAICERTSYNYAAAKEENNTPYGDPWQLVWVFDNNASTEVVCEGYAKAFQYLCDLSGIDCYTVTGIMAGGTGAGKHMWNIVVLGGESYLVDITNCDGEKNSPIVSVGYPDLLLLKGAAKSDGTGCTFTDPAITYKYDDKICALYPASILTVSTKDYVPTQSDPKQGDINGDGKINNTDIILLGRAYMAGTADKYLAIADMNKDGKITNADIILLGRLYMSL